jgi:hypothetical protein
MQNSFAITHLPRRVEDPIVASAATSGQAARSAIMLRSPCLEATMRPLAILVLAACLAASARAAASATAPALDPAIQSALHDLSSDDFTAREHAFRNLQIALGQQVQALLRPDDPETQARVAALLKFNEGLSRWILNTLSLPDPQRRAVLAFGLRADMLPIVAKIGSSSSDSRVEAIHELAPLRDPLATDILAPLLEDDDRAVYIAAMEAAWDREPRDAVVDRLWERAVDAGFAIYNPQPVQPQIVRFRGEELGQTFYDNAAYRHMQDGDIACEVLIHLQAPQVSAKLTAFFDRVETAVNGPNAAGRDNRIWMYGFNSAPMKNVYELLNAYQTPEVLPILYRLATGIVRQPVNGQSNNIRFFWSSRTLPLATLILLTNQSTTDYKLSQINPPSGNWAFPSQLDEDNAIRKLQSWWTTHPHHTAPSSTQP